MTENALTVLILCTGNSARSILAESIINTSGQGRVVAYSAGSFPKGELHPQALALLKRLGHPTDGLRSKSWDEFAGADAPPLDFIFTVCDNAAGEVCPFWPGKPVSAHWGIPDPAAATGSDADVAAAFELAYTQLSRRIDAFLALPISDLSPSELKARLDAIGKTDDQ